MSDATIPTSERALTDLDLATVVYERPSCGGPAALHAPVRASANARSGAGTGPVAARTRSDGREVVWS
jgi:hypothetical protein